MGFIGIWTLYYFRLCLPFFGHCPVGGIFSSFEEPLGPQQVRIVIGLAPVPGSGSYSSTR